MFHFWLLQIALRLSASTWRVWRELSCSGVGGNWPGSVTQLFAWHWCLLRHSCHHSALVSVVLTALITGLCLMKYADHSCRTVQVFRVWKPPPNFPFLCLARGFRLHLHHWSPAPPHTPPFPPPFLTGFDHLQILWCTDLSDLSCEPGWELSVVYCIMIGQFVVISSGQIRGDPSGCHDFDLTLMLLFKMAPMCSIEVLASVFKWKKAVICLKKEICILNKLCPSMISSAAGLEFNVDESTYIK